jgi:hypothetical protein
LPSSEEILRVGRARRIERAINILASLIAIGLAAASVYTYVIRHKGVPPILVALVSGLAIGWTSALVISRWSRRRIYSQDDNFVRGFRIEYQEMRYEVTQNINHHISTHKARVRILRDGVTHLERRFSWTGRGQRAVTVTSKGHFKMGPEQRYGNWDYFYIFLGRQFSASEVVNVSYKVDLHPEHFSTVEPYLYLDGGNPPPDEICIAVALPKDTNMKATAVTVRRMSNYVIDAKDVRTEPDSNEAIWRLSPVRGYQYQLRWSWPDEWGRE